MKIGKTSSLVVNFFINHHPLKGDGFFMFSKISKFFFIALFTFLFINKLFTDSLLELLSFENEIIDVCDGSFLSSDEYYSDYYYLSKENGEKQYLYSNDLRLSYASPFLKNHFFHISINRRETNFFINNLDSMNDRIKFYSGASQIKINLFKELNSSLLLFECSYQRNFNKLKYNITEENIIKSGYIPLAFDKIKAKFKMDLPKSEFGLYVSPLIYIKTHDNFNNKLTGYFIGFDLKYLIKKLETNLQMDYGDISVKLNYQNENFGKIPNMQFLHYFISSNYKFKKVHKFSIGMTGACIHLPERGYLDIEPFVGYWSLFFGSKTFIKKFDMHLTCPFISYEFLLNKALGTLFLGNILSAGYYHFIYKDDIVYTERVITFWPIFLDVPRELDLSPDIDGILNLKLASSLRYRKFQLSFKFCQLLPIRFAKLKKIITPPEDKIEKKERGGSFLEVLLGYNF